jgi:hypothetical protein
VDFLEICLEGLRAPLDHSQARGAEVWEETLNLARLRQKVNDFNGRPRRVFLSPAKAYVRLYAAVHTRALSLAGDCSARAAVASVRAAPLGGMCSTDGMKGNVG